MRHVRIALKYVMTMPALLIQRPHRSAKTKEHSICLERRLISWKQGDIDALRYEGCSTQNQLLSDLSRERSEAQIAGSIANLMFTGKVRAAI